MIDLYNKQIRSILEYAAPVWSPGLSNYDRDEFERIQKSTFQIRFCNNKYEKILTIYNLQSLEERRSEIGRKFADKSSKNVNFQSWFQENKNPYKTRNNMSYKPVFCRTNSWKNSSIPFMTEILNNKYK